MICCQIFRLIGKDMKRLLIFALLMFVAGGVFAAAQTRKQNKKIRQIAAEIAAAYKAKDLGKLDALQIIRGKFRIVIGYAYLDEKDAQPDTVRYFKSFRAAERWLEQRQKKVIDNPSRYVRALKDCSNDRCLFDDGSGSLHNQLYLDEIYYSYRKGRLFIKGLYLWNGD